MLANAERAYAKLDPAPAAAAGRRPPRRLDRRGGRRRRLIVRRACRSGSTSSAACYAEIDAAARPDALIASSTSGLLPTDLQAGLAHPGRLLVAHPFNPVYLLPLVEIVGGKATAPEAIDARDGASTRASA